MYVLYLITPAYVGSIVIAPAYVGSIVITPAYVCSIAIYTSIGRLHNHLHRYKLDSQLFTAGYVSSTAVLTPVTMLELGWKGKRAGGVRHSSFLI